MATRGRATGGLARFGDPGLLILLSLSQGEKHGYAITMDVLEETGMRLGPGTLYGAISKLVQRGLIEPASTDDNRRRPYRMTGEGRAALAEQIETWSRVVSTGRTRLAMS